MTKEELVGQLATQLGASKSEAGRVLDAVVKVLGDAIVASEPFTIPALGTFEVKTRAARTGRNPKTGEAIAIVASRTVAFRPAKLVKERLNR
ncbi:HU family DNA-binding protein [Cupriavidus sp. TMH.W2]|uniref:HU family DNA-binding protein n=1 Tax=Cupriavidus sp. TMH.W2 TaxID=3434465 RepID=UPI003D784B75